MPVVSDDERWQRQDQREVDNRSVPPGWKAREEGWVEQLDVITLGVSR